MSTIHFNVVESFKTPTGFFDPSLKNQTYIEKTYTIEDGSSVVPEQFIREIHPRTTKLKLTVIGGSIWIRLISQKTGSEEHQILLANNSTQEFKISSKNNTIERLSFLLEALEALEVASLFADGEQGGLWLFDTAYQDSAGTTSADAQDDPVGLVLDQRYGEPEPRRNLLSWSNCDVVNWQADNSTLTQLSLNALDMFDGLRIASTGSIGSRVIRQQTFAASQAYIFQVYYIFGTSGLFNFSFRNITENKYSGIQVGESTGDVVITGEDAGTITNVSDEEISDGVKKLTFVFTTTSASLYNFYLNPRTTTVGEYVDALGVQYELGTTPTEYQKIESGIGGEWTPGTHAVQSTTASKPILNYTPTTNKPWLSADSDDSLPVTFTESLGSNCTIARLGADGVTWQESQTVGTSFDLVRASKYNGGAFLIDRALSVAEKRAVERALKKQEPVFGPELVTNGTFDSDVSGWSQLFSEILYSSGTLRVKAIAVGISERLSYQLITGLTVGATYFMSVDVVSQNNGSAVTSVKVRNESNTADILSAGLLSGAIGAISGFFTATATSHYFYLRWDANATSLEQSVDFDNVTVRELI